MPSPGTISGDGTARSDFPELRRLGGRIASESLSDPLPALPALPELSELVGLLSFESWSEPVSVYIVSGNLTVSSLNDDLPL